MKPDKLGQSWSALLKRTDEAIEKAIKRGDARLAARLIHEQRHNLKAVAALRSNVVDSQ
jgi:hypothetical protein